MATKVLVPRMGEGVDELTIVKWLKKEGDPIKELESLLEVETDKVVTEIPSPASGIVLKISIPENTPVTVGKIIAWIGQPGEKVDESDELKTKKGSPKKTLPEEKTNAEPPYIKSNQKMLETPGSRDFGFLSPIVRKLLAENKLNPSDLSGTGLNGRITKEDVLAYLNNQGSKRSIMSPGETIPITSIRRQIADRLQKSKKISPHVLTVMEADMSRVQMHRESNRAAFDNKGIKLTLTAYLVVAISQGLRKNPLMNSTWTEQGILLHNEINVGMATSLGEEGLIIPVINHADELSLIEIAKAVNDLSTRARTHKLRPEEVRNGTFTLTNHGIGGSLFAMPIINQPQCGILGSGSVQKRVVVVTDEQGNDSIAIRPMIYLSLVFDHRILDGASADVFLTDVRNNLEEWPL